MKKFLLVMLSLLVFSLLVVIALFVWLLLTIKNHQPAVAPVTTSSTGEVVDVPAPPAGSVPLKDLPLTEAQADTLDLVGVDVDTFVITPAMQACGKEKLGETRYAEILAGATPTALETAQLLPCLGSE